MSVREENLNVMLAELLAERGLRALGEVVMKRRGRRPEPDVHLMINGVRIVLEGKKPGMWAELEEKCRQRLDDNICDLCIMVEYLDWAGDASPIMSLAPTQTDIKRALLNGRFNMGVMSYVERVGLEKWLEGAPSKSLEVYREIGFHELVSHIIAAYDRTVREDVLKPVIERLDGALKEFATNMKQSIDPERLGNVLEGLKTALELREKNGEED